MSSRSKRSPSWWVSRRKIASGSSSGQRDDGVRRSGLQRGCRSWPRQRSWATRPRWARTTRPDRVTASSPDSSRPVTRGGDLGGVRVLHPAPRRCGERVPPATPSATACKRSSTIRSNGEAPRPSGPRRPPMRWCVSARRSRCSSPRPWPTPRSATRRSARSTGGLFYGSASYDETVFDQPDRFDILRYPNLHAGSVEAGYISPGLTSRAVRNRPHVQRDRRSPPGDRPDGPHADSLGFGSTGSRRCPSPTGETARVTGSGLSRGPPGWLHDVGAHRAREARSVLAARAGREHRHVAAVMDEVHRAPAEQLVAGVSGSDVGPGASRHRYSKRKLNRSSWHGEPRQANVSVWPWSRRPPKPATATSQLPANDARCSPSAVSCKHLGRQCRLEAVIVRAVRDFRPRRQCRLDARTTPRRDCTLRRWPGAGSWRSPASVACATTATR